MPLRFKGLTESIITKRDRLFTGAEGGVVGGVGVSSVVVGRFSGCCGGTTSSTAANEPRRAERHQRQSDPGRDRQRHSRPADRPSTPASVILHVQTSSHVYTHTGSVSLQWELQFLTTIDDAVALLAAQWTCDLQVAGSSPGWAPLRSGLGQAILTPVCLCH